ncbi:MAG: sugar nucleotide-binding protein [Elusimicrobia bacterium]|nr:sugar nucleotide-binding protein [Elusimicrobiota bacterium]
MRLLLAGHRGYVGSGLFSYLSSRHQVTGWSRREDLLALTPKALARRRVDAVINCAVETDRESPGFAVDSPSDRVNVEGARHLARVLKGSRVAWLQISTKDVFGPVFGPADVVTRAGGYRPKRLVDDEQPFAPATLYGKSKLIAEFFSESHPRSAVIRLSTCYTDFDHPRGNWMVRMLRAACAGRPVPVTRDGLQFRDPLHADDLGRLIERVLARRFFGEKVNAGGGPENVISLLEFVRLAAPGAKLRRLPGGDWGFAFSNRKLRSRLGFTPRVSLRERIPALAANVARGALPPGFAR